jgi:hypothetical protein
MNSYATSARYMRVAVCALSLSLCGQTKCAGDSRIDLMGVAGAAIAGVSFITRLSIDPLSTPGLILDATCFLTNAHAVCSGKPYRFLSIIEAGSILGLGLQHTKLIPALELGFHDPLKSIRPAVSFISGFIIGLRFWNNYVYPKSRYE